MKKLSVLPLVLLAVACGDHYSTQEAYEVCDSLVQVIDTDSEDTFAQCVACYEDCGGDCQQEGSPVQFVCPD